MLYNVQPDYQLAPSQLGAGGGSASHKEPTPTQCTTMYGISQKHPCGPRHVVSENEAR
jgi:hypothetical protein